MPGKLPVVIEKVTVKKSFDTKLTKSAPEILETALVGAFKSSKLEIAKSVKKGEKGFQVNARIVEIGYDEKKKTLSVNVTAELQSLPGPNLFASLKGGSAVDGADLKKLDRDLKDALAAIVEGLAKKGVSAMEAQIDKM